MCLSPTAKNLLSNLQEPLFNQLLGIDHLLFPFPLLAPHRHLHLHLLQWLNHLQLHELPHPLFRQFFLRLPPTRLRNGLQSKQPLHPIKQSCHNNLESNNLDEINSFVESNNPLDRLLTSPSRAPRSVLNKSVLNKSVLNKSVLSKTVLNKSVIPNDS